MTGVLSRVWSGGMLAVCVVLLGCSPQSSRSTPTSSNASSTATTGHVHGADYPRTYADAVLKVEQLRNSIREALTKGDTEKAHEPLHEIGHLLGHLPGLAEKSSLAPAQAAAVKKSSDELLSLFGQIDDKMHDGREADYQGLSTQIDAAVEALQQAIKP